MQESQVQAAAVPDKKPIPEEHTPAQVFKSIVASGNVSLEECVQLQRADLSFNQARNLAVHHGLWAEVAEAHCQLATAYYYRYFKYENLNYLGEMFIHANAAVELVDRNSIVRNPFVMANLCMGHYFRAIGSFRRAQNHYLKAKFALDGDTDPKLEAAIGLCAVAGANSHFRINGLEAINLALTHAMELPYANSSVDWLTTVCQIVLIELEAVVQIAEKTGKNLVADCSERDSALFHLVEAQSHSEVLQDRYLRSHCMHQFKMLEPRVNQLLGIK